MTESSPNVPSASPAKSTPARERWAKAWSTAQFYLAIVLTGGFAAYLFLFPHGIGKHAEDPPRPRPVEIVQTIGPRTIQIQKGSGLEQKLELTKVQEARITSPLLSVTGTVVASLRPGGKAGSDFWQFNSPEVLTAYTDWQRAVADATFSETHLKQIADLAQTRLAAQRKVVDQLERLVQAGTESLKSLAAEQTLLAEHEIQGKKEVHEAESALRIARRQEAALAQQLQQSGLEPSLLQSATADLDIIVADVPEVFLSRVKVGQQCTARFLGIAGQDFGGIVKSILPVLSRERRTLRLLFVIDDPQDQLRPGMFAEIGLGTDPREALLASAEGVLHIGRADYVLARPGDDGPWHITEVQVGEPQHGQVEVLQGMAEGDRLIGKGAILLKPVVVRSLQTEDTESVAPRLSRAESP
jgi:membrane fusion protein, heavy metal efflux system